MRPQRRDRRLEAGAVTQRETCALQCAVCKLRNCRCRGDLADFNAIGTRPDDYDFRGVRDEKCHDFLQERVIPSAGDDEMRVVEPAVVSQFNPKTL